MPATDPINPNVHPLIYRWNGILGQSQAAALEAAGKDGIIYNSTYTNFWQGAMAWSGWWHNQVGLLTEVASARRVADRAAARRARRPAGARGRRGRRRPAARRDRSDRLPPPRDITPRTEYPRPWLGGRWTLRDIVDYELIATMAPARDGGRPARDAAAADLRGEPRHGRGRRARATRPPSSSRSRASSSRARPSAWSTGCRWAAWRSGAPTRRSRPTASTTPPARSSSR